MMWYPPVLQAHVVPSQVKGQTQSAASISFGLPDFVSARLTKFRRVMSLSFLILMASFCAPSPQNIYLQGRACQRSHVLTSHPGKRTCHHKPSSLPRTRVGLWRAGCRHKWQEHHHTQKNRVLPFKDQQAHGPSTAPMDGAQHGLLSGFRLVIASQAPMERHPLLAGVGAGNPVGLEMQTAPVKLQ